EILNFAESDFENALYIHLLRHPGGVVRSFEEARLDQTFFFRREHSFTVRELAELIWLLSHQNILDFLECVPAERQRRVRFEDLVTQPAKVLEGICEFLQVDFRESMLEPYEEQRAR